MDKESLIIYDNVAEKLVTWTEKRIGKFVKTYYEALKSGVRSVSTGDDAIDMLVGCMLASSHRRGRGGQPGNQNARRQSASENECETNIPNNNIIEDNKRESEDTRPHVRTTELLPFPRFMSIEEKRHHLWEDIVKNKGSYSRDVLEDFAKYYGMPSAKEKGKILCEECLGWDTKTMLERWIKRQHN